MKKHIIISLIPLFFISCGNQNKTTSTKEKVISEWERQDNPNSEIDTTVFIDSYKYKILCKYSDIPNNTSNQKWENEDTIYIEKTKNCSGYIQVWKNDVFLLKKTFIKEDFKKYIGSNSESLYQYIMTGFGFDGIKDNKLIFHASVCLNNSDDLTNIIIEINKSGELKMAQDNSNEY